MAPLTAGRGHSSTPQLDLTTAIARLGAANVAAAVADPRGLRRACRDAALRWPAERSWWRQLADTDPEDVARRLAADGIAYLGPPREKRRLTGAGDWRR